MTLPPGQRPIHGFPRFGTHLGRPAPPVPAVPVIEIGGAGVESFALPRGLDGHRSVVAVADALADDVLIAERLDGRPLDGDHGAPARLVSPRQYGYISTKHLCRIELHSGAPHGIHAAHPLSRVMLRGPLVKPHPRARVWEEERHPYVRPRLLRPLYRLTVPFGVRLGRS
jgi:DMSO/TMAO reductase YedYZ molybdopterin-dependent catalytic subunit